MLTSSWPASHVTCSAHAPASHVRNVCGGDGNAPASHVVGGGGGSGGLGLSVSSSLGGLGEQGPLSPSRNGPLSPRGYEPPQYGKRTCGDPSSQQPPEMRQRLQQLQQLQQRTRAWLHRVAAPCALRPRLQRCGLRSHARRK